MAGHIRKKKLKNETAWEVVLETGHTGSRSRIYRTVRGTKKDAEKLLIELQSQIDNNIFIQRSKVKLGEYLNDWMESYVKPNLSPATFASYKVNIKHMEPLCNIPLQELKPIQLQKFYQQKLENGRLDKTGGLSAKSVRYIHRVLHEALEHAVKMQMVQRNVAKMVFLPKAKSYKSNVYDENMLIKLIKKAKGTDMEIPVSLGVYLGLRRGEMLGLQWSSVNFEEKTVEIKDNLIYMQPGYLLTTPKTESSNRIISMSESLVWQLREHRKKQAKNRLLLGKDYYDGDFVCCKNDGSPYNPGYFSKKYKKFLEDNDLPHIRLHDLRHSNATLMLKQGVPAKVASRRLGHSSISITLDLYSHVTKDMQKEASDRIEAGLNTISNK